MPNHERRHKRAGFRAATSAGKASRPVAMGTLLQKLPLARAAKEARNGEDWPEWLAARLPAGLGSRVTAVVRRDKHLVLFTASAAWCARLRFAVADLEGAIRERDSSVERIDIRVLPRG
jgi:hypothetical protein